MSIASNMDNNEQNTKSKTSKKVVLHISQDVVEQKPISKNQVTIDYAVNRIPRILFKIVPVKMYGKTKTISTYALLDDGSEVSIIDEQLVKDLELQSDVEQPLNLKCYGNITSTQRSRSIILKFVELVRSVKSNEY